MVRTREVKGMTEQFKAVCERINKEYYTLRDTLNYKPLDRKLIGKVQGLNVCIRLLTVALRDLERKNTEQVIKQTLLQLSRVLNVQLKYTLDTTQRNGEIAAVRWTIRQLEALVKGKITCK